MGFDEEEKTGGCDKKLIKHNWQKTGRNKQNDTGKCKSKRTMPKHWKSNPKKMHILKILREKK